MKSPHKEDYFIITSPEDQLKQISLVDTVEKGSFQSPKLNKKQTQKFAIDSWDISQKLQPFTNSSQRYKDTLSTNLSRKLNISKFRAKSAFLTKDLQDSNRHNFNSKKKNTLQQNSDRKSYLFFNTIEKTKKSISLSKQIIDHKKTIKSRDSKQKKVKQQQNQRMKTIQSYLTHQKDIINREKQVIMSQRIGKQGIQFAIYPTEYWQSFKKSSPLRKNRKNKSNKTSLKLTIADQQTLPSTIATTTQRIYSYRTKQGCQKSNSTKSQSPIKRFQLFKDKLHQILIH